MADAGKVMIFPRGNYDSTSVYEVLDLVNHNNASWVAKKNTINGIEPSEANSEYWFKMAGHIVANNLNTSTEGYVLDARQGKILMDEVADAKSQIAQIANNQIPDEYLQASVDAYVAEYSGGFATQANVAEVKSDLSKNTSIKIDGEMMYHSDSYKDGILKMVVRERTETIDDKAFGDYTYRDLFNGSKNLLYPLDFETGTFGNATIAAGNPTITNEDYKTKPYSLKAFGDSSQQLKNFIDIKNGHTYYFACFVNVTRYVQGYAGLLFADYINLGVNNVTDGYVLKSATYDFGKNLTDAVFIGTWSSANADAYVDVPVVIDLTEISATKEEIDALLLEYVELCNVETTTLEFATLESESNKYKKDSVYVGAIMGANSTNDRFLAMKELFEICIGKNDTLTKANYGAVCELPNLNPSMLQNFDLPIIYGKNENTQAVPASVTKVMTLIAGLDYITDIYEKTTIVADDIQDGNNSILSVGDIVTINDLMYAMMLPSSNTGAMAFARVVGEKILKAHNLDGSYTATECQNAFVEEMAVKASNLGMTNSVFVSPSGRSESNLTTAKDLLKMMVEAYSYNSIQKIWNKKSYTIHVKGVNARDIDITTSVANETLESEFYIFGGKTGTLELTNLHIALVAVVKPY